MMTLEEKYNRLREFVEELAEMRDLQGFGMDRLDEQDEVKHIIGGDAWFVLREIDGGV